MERPEISKLSIIIPAYNEEQTIHLILDEAWSRKMGAMIQVAVKPAWPHNRPVGAAPANPTLHTG